MRTRLRQTAIERMTYWDCQIALLMNKTLRWRTVAPFFRVISSLGNGKFWYALMLILPLCHGRYGLNASLHMGLTALVTLLVYKSVKGATQRPRPGSVYQAIRQGTAALDEYSFPSGHTMLAVSFTVIAVAWFPGLLPLLLSFTLLTAVSRVVLGLHYPTDVVLGAIFGLMISQLSIVIAG